MRVQSVMRPEEEIEVKDVVIRQFMHDKNPHLTSHRRNPQLIVDGHEIDLPNVTSIAATFEPMGAIEVTVTFLARFEVKGELE